MIELDIPVEAAAKLIMSAGLIQPGNGDGPKRLAALAEAARVAKLAQDAAAAQAALAGQAARIEHAPPSAAAVK